MVSVVLMLLAAAMLPSYSLRAGNDGGKKQRRPFVEMFRPMYLTTGFPLSESPDKENADVKFQVSLQIPIWRDMAGSGTDILMAYTQVSLWNLYARSSPFYDNQYQPGLYVRKQWNSSGGSPVRTLIGGIEHRSNGRDDAWSRSINYLFVSYARDYDFGLTLQASARIGPGFYGDVLTWDLPLRYLGLVQLSSTYVTPCEGWEFMVSASPLWNRSIANVNVEIGRRIGTKRSGNPYFFLQLHYGYDEAPREWMDVNGPIVNPDNSVSYNRGTPASPRTMVRFGVLLSPKSFMRGNL